MKDIDGGICAVKGVAAWGIKQGKYGLAIIRAQGSTVGVFTRNRVIAAPLVLTRQHIEDGISSALIANSGSANAFTGPEGLEDARTMTALLAQRLDLKEKDVCVASTGVIGRRLKMDRIHDQLDEVIPRLTEDASGSTEAARAIMTTDTFSKEVAVELDNGIRIGGIAKGSGMIEPDMGTMLAFLYTDAAIEPDMLKRSLTTAVDRSFNMLVVDGDTSTNDTVLLTATGISGSVDLDEFQKGLERVCTSLTRMIARDGEGATKVIEARVRGAACNSDAVLAAKAIVRSPLVKTAIFGKDPNWGRVIAAVGYSKAQVDQDIISLEFEGGNDSLKLVDRGRVIEQDGTSLKKIMGYKEIIIIVDLNLGSSAATAWGCDLTYDYVRINAEYTT